MTGFSQREAQWSGASFQDREKEREGFEVVKKLRELVRYHITYKGVESGKFKVQRTRRWLLIIWFWFT